jgi:hypothetical protein
MHFPKPHLIGILRKQEMTTEKLPVNPVQTLKRYFEISLTHDPIAEMGGVWNQSSESFLVSRIPFSTSPKHLLDLGGRLNHTF